MPRHPLMPLVCGLNLLFGTPACMPDDRCPGDMYEYDPRYAVCLPVTEPGGAEDDGGSPGDNDAGSDAAGSSDTVPFGAACTDDADCGPGLCVNMPIMVGCTQRGCMVGQEHAGICPDGWMCLADPSTGESACINL